MGIPFNISYSKPAIWLSVIASSWTIILIVTTTTSFIRSEQAKGKRKFVPRLMAILISLVYLGSIYHHWKQPVISSDNFEIGIVPFQVTSQIQTMASYSSFSASCIYIRTGVPIRRNNFNDRHLRASVNCSITNKRYNTPVSFYNSVGGNSRSTWQNQQRIYNQLHFKRY